SKLILACSRLLRAREAILASGESAGHQRAGVREQRIGLLVQRSRRESEPRELLTYPGTFLRHARPPWQDGWRVRNVGPIIPRSRWNRGASSRYANYSR